MREYLTSLGNRHGLRRRPWGWLRAIISAACVLVPALALAQANYEIQVYGADTVPPENLMVALHSNFTVDGEKYAIDGVYPTNHQEHETLELTEGINDWSEVGFYVFTSAHASTGVVIPR